MAERRYKSEGARYARYFAPGVSRIEEHDELVMRIP